MTIEERLLNDKGDTDIPELAVWMLRDGTLVNGFIEGRQRDIDHHEINAYYKPSKLASPGSGYVYIIKFMRRGNIRMGCSASAFCAEYLATPTQEQFDALCKIMHGAMKEGIETCIGQITRSGTKYMTFPQYLRHVERYCRKLDIPGYIYDIL